MRLKMETELFSIVAVKQLMGKKLYTFRVSCLKLQVFLKLNIDENKTFYYTI